MFYRVFNSSKTIFKKNEQLLFIIAGVLALLVTIHSGFVLFHINSQLEDLTENLTMGSGASAPLELFVGGIYLFIAGLFINIFKVIILFPLQIFFFYQIIGKDKTLLTSISYFVKRLFPFIFTMFIFFLFIFPLYLALIIPGIIFSLLWMFFSHALFFRDKKFYAALKYSKSLVNGHKMRTANHFAMLQWKIMKYWIPLIAIWLLTGLVSSNTSQLLFTFVESFFVLIIGFFGVIFSVRYFLELEKEDGIANELVFLQSSTVPDTSHLIGPI